MLDENQLTVIDENGNELLCEILFTFDSDDYNKSYKIISRGRYMTENSDVTVTFVIYSLLISQAQGDTKVMLQKAFNNLKNALNMKNI